MTTKFTVGNAMRAAADAADAADVATSVNNAMMPRNMNVVTQVRRIAGDAAAMAENVADCWRDVINWACTGASAEDVVAWCENKAANNAGPDDEEFDNCRAVAWMTVGAAVKAQFMD